MFHVEHHTGISPQEGSPELGTFHVEQCPAAPEFLIGGSNPDSYVFCTILSDIT